MCFACLLKMSVCFPQCGGSVFTSSPLPFTKSAPACLEMPTSGDDKNVSRSVMYPDNSEEEDDGDGNDLSDNFK